MIRLYFRIPKELFMINQFSLNIAVVDDVPAELDALCAVLQDYAAANGLTLTLHRFLSAQQLLADYRPLAYTAIFMDIYMDNMTGMDAAKRLRTVDSDTLIIFLTYSGEHMPDAFRFHAFDYITKPIEKKRIFGAMDDILKRHTALFDSPALTITCNRTQYRISYAQIAVVRAQANYLAIMDTEGNTYKTRMTFSSVKDVLCKDIRFLQLLRGVLVNMDCIVEFDDKTCRLAGDISLPINVRNARQIEQIWKNYIFNRLRKEQMERFERGHL